MANDLEDVLGALDSPVAVVESENTGAKQGEKPSKEALMKQVLADARKQLQADVTADPTIVDKAGANSDDIEVTNVMFFGDKGNPVVKKDPNSGEEILKADADGKMKKELDQQGKTVGYGFKNISGENGRPEVTFQVQKTIYHEGTDDEGRQIFTPEVTVRDLAPGETIYLTRADSGRFATRIEFNMQFSNAICLSKAPPEVVEEVRKGADVDKMFVWFQIRFNKSKTDGVEDLGVNDPTRRIGVGESVAETTKGNKIFAVKQEWKEDFGGAYMCYKAPSNRRRRATSGGGSSAFMASRPNALAALFRAYAASTNIVQTGTPATPRA